MNDARHTFWLSVLAPVPYAWQLHSRTRALADEFARRGVRVRYVAPPTPRAMLRHWVTPWRDRRAGDVELVWPFPAPPLHWQRRLGMVDTIAGWQAGRIAGGQQAAGIAAARQDEAHVVVAATPLWTPVVRRLRRNLLIYDCLDDPLVHARASSSDIYVRWHAELCRGADVVVAVSAALADRLREATDRPVVVCGNGVDAQAFGAIVSRESAATSATSHEPAAGHERSLRDWLSWRRAHPDQPVAGFVGSIDRWVDVELLAALARALPQVQIVVAGPERRRRLTAPLAGISNVHRIGLVPYPAVPALIGTFDVGLIPFKPGPITAVADPLKVYEYAAAGKAVVSSVELLLDDANAPIVAAATPEDFVNAVSTAAAVGNSSIAERERRIVFATGHTWAARAEQFLAVIEERLGAACRPA